MSKNLCSLFAIASLSALAAACTSTSSQNSEAYGTQPDNASASSPSSGTSESQMGSGSGSTSSGSTGMGNTDSGAAGTGTSGAGTATDATTTTDTGATTDSQAVDASPSAPATDGQGLGASGVSATEAPSQQATDPDAIANQILGPADENFDGRFLNAVAFEMQSAIQLAREATTKTQDKAVTNVATRAIATRQAALRDLNDTLDDVYTRGNRPEKFDTTAKRTVAIPQEQRALLSRQANLGPADNQFNTRFAQALMSHGNTVMAMAKEAASKARNEDVREVAQEIMENQRREIAVVNNLLSKGQR